MERKLPGQDHEPEVVVDAPDDARGHNQPAWTAGTWIALILGFVVLAAGLLWVGQLFGLAAAILPGGLDNRTAALWAGLGVVGLGLLLLIVFGVRRARRTSK
jgi:hypothetical protein